MGLHFKPTYKDTATKAIDIKLVVGFIGMDERFFSSSSFLQFLWIQIDAINTLPVSSFG